MAGILISRAHAVGCELRPHVHLLPGTCRAFAATRRWTRARSCNAVRDIIDVVFIEIRTKTTITATTALRNSSPVKTNHSRTPTYV